MRDLEKDFGFRLGPWNQGYMFDTLPITVEREEDMKPGDLVFISATYFNQKSKTGNFVEIFHRTIMLLLCFISCFIHTHQVFAYIFDSECL